MSCIMRYKKLILIKDTQNMSIIYYYQFLFLILFIMQNNVMRVFFYELRHLFISNSYKYIYFWSYCNKNLLKYE